MDQSIAMCSRSKNSKKGGEQQRSDGSSTATMRKGPWTEEEDAQLVLFVRLFGERRWDFLAKVSGLRGGGCSPNPHARIRSISTVELRA
jgi:transcription factor MYB, plant